MKILKVVYLIIFIATISISSPSVVNASDDDLSNLTENTRPTEKPWFVLAGYGITHNGLGQTQTNVETVDFVVGHEKILTETFGPPVLRGYHSLVVEVPIHFVVDPWEDPMFGLNILARWTFETDSQAKPYVFGGGGPVYTEANIPGLGSKLNGNWQFGGGVKIPSSYGNEMILEYRFHHISNLGTRDPNDSLNSSKFLIGVKF